MPILELHLVIKVEQKQASHDPAQIERDLRAQKPKKRNNFSQPKLRLTSFRFQQWHHQFRQGTPWNPLPDFQNSPRLSRKFQVSPTRNPSSKPSSSLSFSSLSDSSRRKRPTSSPERFPLLVIGFFPSQAPDFFTRTISAQFWEVIHLLFIGIAVSYGLFGRRKSSQNFEISRIEDDLSGISHLSSIFEDGFGSTCNGTDGRERDSTQRYNASCCSCQCFGGSVLGQSGCVVHGGSIGAEVRSFGSNNASGDIEKNAKKNRTWISKNSKGESLVAVANAESLDSKPLNLPVRSLRTSFADSVKVGDKGKNNIETTKIRGVVPKNLEKRFDESDELSPRSCRMGNEEKGDDEERNDIKPRVHCSPHTAWDFEFEHIKSWPSNEVLKFSTSTDLETLRVRGAEGENVTSASHPKIAPLTDVGNGSYEENKDVGKGKRPIEHLESGKKPLALVKAKSVRTIKPRRYVVTSRKAESPLVNLFEAENLLVNHPNEEVDLQFSLLKPKPSLPDFFEEEKEEHSIEKKDSEEDRESELKESSGEEEDAKTNIDCDLGSEVDRKAGEFIAKFREQIRRQKALSSAEKYSREFL